MMRENRTKARIFSTATRLFAQKGYHSVTVRELSQGADVNEALLYYYFTNKEGILKEIFTVFRRKLSQHQITRKQIDALIHVETPRQILQRCILRFPAEDAEFMELSLRIVWMEQFTNPEAQKLMSEGFHGGCDGGIRYALERLVEHGQIPALDTKKFTIMWDGALFSSTFVWSSETTEENAVQANSIRREAMAEFLIDMAVGRKML